MKEVKFWLSYQDLHDKNPRSDSEAKVNFYNQNSEFITRSSKNPNPELAVIIPAYNESALIARTLASINQSVKSQDNVNIFIVDNASTDDTAEIAQIFGARVIKEPKKGIGQARQTGLESVPSSVKYILTTDADTFVPGQWVADHYNLLNSFSANFTYGKTDFLPDSKLKFIDNISFNLHIQACKLVHWLKEKNGQGSFITGGSNNGFNKELAILVGGYNPSLSMGEDTDLMRKISRYGKTEKVDSIVLTSARRILGEGIINRSISRLKANLFGDVKNEDYSNIKYEDYRESDSN